VRRTLRGTRQRLERGQSSAGRPPADTPARSDPERSAGVPGQTAEVPSARGDALKQGRINQVDRARLVAWYGRAAADRGKARYAHTAKIALVKGLWRIVELPAVKVGLTAAPGRALLIRYENGAMLTEHSPPTVLMRAGSCSEIIASALRSC
jgi:hypothetical protein